MLSMKEKMSRLPLYLILLQVILNQSKNYTTIVETKVTDFFEEIQWTTYDSKTVLIFLKSASLIYDERTLND